MSIESGHVGTNAPKVDEWRDGLGFAIEGPGR